MLKALSQYSICCILLLFLWGCNDRFSPVGSEFLTDTVGVFTISTDSAQLISKATSYHRRLNNTTIFNNGVIYIGKAGDVEAFSMIRMVNIPDTLGAIAASDIISAKLKLQPVRYVFGDSVANNLSFNVVKVLKLWRPTVTLDSITPDFFDSKTLASFTGQVPLKDSMDAISMDFDKDILIEWFKLRQQTKNDSLIYGIALRPTGANSVVRAFSTGIIGQTERKTSTIEVIYKRSDATLDTLVLRSGYDGAYFNAPLPTNEDIVIQGGLPFVTELLCDFSSLPANVAIQKAELILTYDASRSIFGNSGRDSVIFATYVDSTRSNRLGSTFGIATSGTDKFSYPVVSGFVEAGYRSTSKHGTILLQVYDRIFRSDRYVFYGPNHPDKSKRPKLTIIYSTRP